jgi:hypothetical protein
VFDRPHPRLALGALLAGAMLFSACAAPMSDAARLWCLDHDQSASGYPPGTGSDYRTNLVSRAAQSLGIPVPARIAQDEADFALWQLSGWADSAAPNVDGFHDALVAWRTTTEYARACNAAFGSRG